MAKKIRKVVIETKAELRVGDDHPDGPFYWLSYKSGTMLDADRAHANINGDIARAAVRLGYKHGDEITYKIVVERKR